MAFPTVQSVTATVFDTQATAHLVSMPATVNSGDLLYVHIMTISADTPTLPTGWSLLHTSSVAGSFRDGRYYKIAAGTEGGTTVDFVTGGARRGVAHTYRITGWHGTTPPEVGTIATGATTTPNPPSLTPSWGAEDTLWLAEFASLADVSVSVYPTSYTNGQEDSFTTVGGTVGTSRRNLNATSDNPGTFTISASNTWGAQTVAIRTSATTPVTGTIAASQDANTGNISGTVANPITGTIAVTQANQTMAATGTESMSGTVAANQDPNVAAFTGIMSNPGIVAASQDPNLAAAIVPGYADLTGAAGSYVTTPDHASLDIVGDLDVRILVAPADWTPTSFQYLASKWGAVGQQSWFFSIATTGLLRFAWSTTGTNQMQANATVPTGFVDGTFHWLRVTIDVDNGATNYEVKFYTSLDPPLTDPSAVTWTQLGTTVIGAVPIAVTSIFASTAAVVLGSDVGGTGRLNGDVYYAEIRDGIAGTIVASPDFRDADQITTPNTVFTDTQGRAWTINSPAAWVANTTTGGWVGLVTNPVAAGIITATQADQTAVINGTVANPITGTIAVTQASNTGVLTGSVNITATLAATQASNTAVINGTVANPITGVIGATQADQTAVFMGTTVSDGSLNAIQANQTGVFTGLVANPVSGTIGVTQQDQTGTFTGTNTPAGITGTIGAIQDPNVAAFTGINAPPTITGTIGAVQDPNQAVINSTAFTSVTGVLAGVQAANVMVTAGTVANPFVGAIGSVTCTLGGPTADCVLTSWSATCTIHPVNVVAGSAVQITTTFRDSDGNLADPINVTATVQAPDGTQSSPVPGSASVGVWTTTVTTDQAGYWFYQIAGVGNDLDVVCTGSFCATPSLVLV